MSAPPAIDEELLGRLPLPLAQLYRRAADSTAPWERHQAAYYLWEATLKLMGSVAVVAYLDSGIQDENTEQSIRRFSRAALGEWWRLVRHSAVVLDEAGDVAFRDLRRFLLGKSRSDLPRAAKLHAELAALAGKPAKGRDGVRISALFDRLLRYRNDNIGHGAAGHREADFYQHYGRLLLDGVTDVLSKLDPLAGRRLVYVADVRRLPSSQWQVECLELVGENPRELPPVTAQDIQTDELPRPRQVYLHVASVEHGNSRDLQLSVQSLRCAHPLLWFDAQSGDFSFLHTLRTGDQLERLCYATGEVTQEPAPQADRDGLLVRIRRCADDSADVSTTARSTNIQHALSGLARGMAFLKKPEFRGAFLGVFLALVCWAFTRLDFFRGVERSMFDACVVMRGERSSRAREKIVIIAMDDASIDELGKPLAFVSPELAKVVRYLDRQGADAVGVDVILRESLATEGGPDLKAIEFGEAIEENGKVVLAKWSIKGRWQLPHPQWRLKHFKDPRPTDLGFVNLSADADHVIRRQQLAFDGDDGPELQFALAMFALEQKSADKVSLSAQDKLHVGARRIPLDASGRLRINYAGPPGTFRTIPFSKVVAAANGATLDSAQFDDAIVIIGATSVGSQDVHPTPYSSRGYFGLFSRGSGLMSGPEIHANIIATLWDEAFIHTCGPAWTLLILIVFGGGLGYAFSRLTFFWGMILLVAHHLAWRMFCLLAFAAFNWQFELLSMLVLGFVVFAAVFAMRWWRLRRMLGVVKSESITRALETGQASFDERGEIRVVTILVARIRGFANFSHHHTPREVLRLLNAFCSHTVRVVERRGGTLSHYTGEGFMALFNAPAYQEDDAQSAVQAAVELAQAVSGEADLWRELGMPGLQADVGVHRGEAVFGAIGSPRRLDYSALGEAVNLAGKIQETNVRLDTKILISGDVRRAIAAPQREQLGIRRESHFVQLENTDAETELFEVAPAAATRI